MWNFCINFFQCNCLGAAYALHGLIANAYKILSLIKEFTVLFVSGCFQMGFCSSIHALKRLFYILYAIIMFLFSPMPPYSCSRWTAFPLPHATIFLSTYGEFSTELDLSLWLNLKSMCSLGIHLPSSKSGLSNSLNSIELVCKVHRFPT